MAGAAMRRFWDARAREDAAYFVDNTLAYRSGDMDAFWRAGEEVVDLVLGRLGVALAPHDEVVEIGCGIGRCTRALAARAHRVRAIDVSPEMLQRARAASPELANVEWLHGDGVSLAVIQGFSADACFSHVVFQHIPDPAVTLGYVREMGRVLRPGGWSAFQVSNDPHVHRRRTGPRALARRAGAAIGVRPRGQAHPAWLGSAVDLDELTAVAADAGLAVERVDGRGTQFCYVLLRRSA